MKNRGFTLIELLVVVAIIAILAAVLLPGLSQARKSSRKIYCANTLRMFTMASNMYADESDNWYRIRSDGIPWYRDPIFRGILNLDVSPTARNFPRNLVCPDATYALNTPAAPGQYVISYSYGMNMSDTNVNIDPATGVIPPFQGYKRTSVVAPGSRILWGDSLDWWIRMDLSENYRGEDAALVAISTYQVWVTAYRHQNAVNIGFFDGHVETLSRNKVDRLKTTDHTLWYPLR